jgi:hypothetical protein
MTTHRRAFVNRPAGAAAARAGLVAWAACAACGDNWPARPDAAIDATIDARVDPPPPPLGEMVDRVGRPLIARLLIGTTSPEAERAAAQQQYQRLGPLDGFRFEVEMARHIALFDGADSYAFAGDQCRSAASGTELASILANDRLFVDTDQGNCTHFFEVERAFLVSRGTSRTSCGGYMPTQDAVDTMYSILIRALGTPGNPGPPVPDGAQPHNDYLGNDSFPFLAREHL